MKHQINLFYDFISRNIHWLVLFLLFVNYFMALKMNTTAKQVNELKEELNSISNSVECVKAYSEENHTALTNQLSKIKKLEYDMPMHPELINWKIDDLAHRLESENFEYIKWSHVY